MEEGRKEGLIAEKGFAKHEWMKDESPERLGKT